MTTVSSTEIVTDYRLEPDSTLHPVALTFKTMAEMGK
jgi:hypothetical protein